MEGGDRSGEKSETERGRRKLVSLLKYNGVIRTAAREWRGRRQL